MTNTASRVSRILFKEIVDGDVRKIATLVVEPAISVLGHTLN